MSRKSKVVIPWIQLHYETAKQKKSSVKKAVAQPCHVAEYKYMELIPKKGADPLAKYRKGGVPNE